MGKTVKTFKHFSEKGYKHYTENTIEELDELPLGSSDIITEFAHLREWLRINHGIWVSVHTTRGYFVGNWSKINTPYGGDTNVFNSPQESYSAAFDYIRLNKLI